MGLQRIRHDLTTEQQLQQQEVAILRTVLLLYRQLPWQGAPCSTCSPFHSRALDLLLKPASPYLSSVSPPFVLGCDIEHSCFSVSLKSPFSPSLAHLSLSQDTWGTNSKDQPFTLVTAATNKSCRVLACLLETRGSPCFPGSSLSSLFFWWFNTHPSPELVAWVLNTYRAPAVLPMVGKHMRSSMPHLGPGVWSVETCSNFRSGDQGWDGGHRSWGSVFLACAQGDTMDFQPHASSFSFWS